MDFPSGLSYSKTHEWIQDIGGGAARIGITDYAQNELGDIVFVNLPETGDEASKGERIADVESVKAVSDIISPLSGVVKAVNKDVADNPESMNADPYGAWLIEISDISDHEELLSAEDYRAFCEEEG
ncbi:MAG: glycine cleavage system protein GcvH [Synergistaceae bacterium]|jgi:glycine cleavage system H protein|nr:glycine cleavage system protein GcvH [Synergistaceae bacterium]